MITLDTMMYNHIYCKKVFLESVSEEIVKFLKRNDSYKMIVNRLHFYGNEVYITGGFIRDFLSGRGFSKDVDFVTNATPDRLKEMFQDRKVATGGESFLVTFVDGVEIATYRKDIVNTGKRTECWVDHADSIEEDLGRRDFTINSIAFSPITGEFIDPFSGIGDIEDKKISFVGDPDDRIREDNERILRACRFIAVMDGSFEHNTLLALKRNSHLIQNVASERICLEIKKAMKVQQASKFFESMRLIGCLKYVFPSLENCYDKDGGPHHDETIYQHCMDAGDSIVPKYWRTKLAGYLHDVGKPPCAEIDEKTLLLKFIGHESKGSEIVRYELKALSFSNDDIDFISNSVAVHMRSFNKTLSKRALRRFMVTLTKCGIGYRDWFRLFMADKHANRKSRDFTFGEIKSFIEKIKYIDVEEHVFSIKDLQIDGFDVMKTLNLEQGPAVGKILKEVFDYCIDNPGDNNREFLLDFIINRPESEE